MTGPDPPGNSMYGDDAYAECDVLLDSRPFIALSASVDTDLEHISALHFVTGILD